MKAQSGLWCRATFRQQRCEMATSLPVCRYRCQWVTRGVLPPGVKC